MLLPAVREKTAPIKLKKNQPLKLCLFIFVELYLFQQHKSLARLRNQKNLEAQEKQKIFL